MKAIRFFTLTLLVALSPVLFAQQQEQEADNPSPEPENTQEQDTGNQTSEPQGGQEQQAGSPELERSDRSLFLYLGAGLDFGGDKIAEVRYTDGSSDSMDAGDGVHFAIGLDYEFNEQYMIRATVGRKSDSIDAMNGEITFTRTPMEITGYRFFGKHGIGGGLTKHSGGEFECDISGVCDSSTDVDANTGVVVEYLYRTPRWKTSAGYSLGVRVGRGIAYEPENGVGEDADGDFIGINVGIIL